jgi:hypothetical protein
LWPEEKEPPEGLRFRNEDKFEVDILVATVMNPYVS